MSAKPIEPGDQVAIRAPMEGTVVAVLVSEGDPVRAGIPLLRLESMKTEHPVGADATGVVRDVSVAVGDTVLAGDLLVTIEAGEVDLADEAADVPVDLDAIRPDLAEVRERHALTQDAARPDAVARRHRAGHRTARENLADLCDPDSFVEYGALAIAAQRGRRDLDELIRATPADGFVAGVAQVNGKLFGRERARCAVMSYDYTVLAGTQGYQGHRKKDRLFELAERLHLPVVLFAEGGGGRPGDTDAPAVSGLEVMAFALFARLSALAPLVGVVLGPCFAGNAALVGCCDVIIATRDAVIGMAGPAMIEGAGLGRYRPEQIGSMAVQSTNGVVDVVVADDAEAVRVAKQHLSYFQGPLADWSCADQRMLRMLLPADRTRAYDVGRVVEQLADTGSVLELRGGWAPGMVTALARVEGLPVGIIANNPSHLGGAIDADGADKAARFMQLCDAHGLPVVFLCDTPGFMVGPEAERTAQVRHFARMFVVGASLTVPYLTVVLRKAYGLGAQAMAGGSFRSPLLTVAWPTAELGPMGLEGAVRLGFRRELDAVADPAEREALFRRLVGRLYERGKAVNAAAGFEVDDVIDPADSRACIVGVLRAAAAPPPRAGRKRPCVDAW